MPAGSLSFPLLSPVALAAVLTSSTPLALGKAQASLALLSLLRRCSVAVQKSFSQSMNSKSVGRLTP